MELQIEKRQAGNQILSCSVGEELCELVQERARKEKTSISEILRACIRTCLKDKK